MAQPTKIIRIYENTWRRFKKKAGAKGITLIQLLEELSKGHGN